jgi:hypothetical protein
MEEEEVPELWDDVVSEWLFRRSVPSLVSGLLSVPDPDSPLAQQGFSPGPGLGFGVGFAF